MQQQPICSAFAAIADLCVALGAAPANKHPACWEVRLDDHWEIAFNGHQKPMASSHGTIVNPYHCHVQYNGWPAGIFNPYGGAIAAGECANEYAFLAAVKGRMPH